MGNKVSLKESKENLIFNEKYNISLKDLAWVEIKNFEFWYRDFKFGYKNGYSKEVRIASNVFFVCFPPYQEDIHAIVERVRKICEINNIIIYDLK